MFFGCVLVCGLGFGIWALVCWWLGILWDVCVWVCFVVCFGFVLGGGLGFV